MLRSCLPEANSRDPPPDSASQPSRDPSAGPKPPTAANGPHLSHRQPRPGPQLSPVSPTCWLLPSVSFLLSGGQALAHRAPCPLNTLSLPGLRVQGSPAPKPSLLHQTSWTRNWPPTPLPFTPGGPAPFLLPAVPFPVTQSLARSPAADLRQSLTAPLISLPHLQNKPWRRIKNVDFWAVLPEIQILIPHFFWGWGGDQEATF